MPLQKCATCHTQFNVNDVADNIRVMQCDTVSTIIFPHLTERCCHCGQHYLVMMGVGAGGRITFQLRPVAPPEDAPRIITPNSGIAVVGR